MSLRALLLAALLLLLAAGRRRSAAAPKVDLIDVEDEVMCVDCGIPLNTAEGAQPDSERELIRDLIAQGKTKEQIKQELVAQYGEDVLALPETSGVGITAYAIPLVLLALVVARARPARAALAAPAGGGDGRADGATAGAAAGAGAAGAVAVSDADAARLDEDLARYDG